MNKFFSTAILSGAALAGLAAAFVASSEPVEARGMSCIQRYRACNSRCGRYYDDPVPCIHRTCNVQHDNCEGRGRGLVANPKQPGNAGPHTPRPSGNSGPFVPDGVKPKQNGGIVPGGMRPKGGIFRDGPMRQSGRF